MDPKRPNPISPSHACTIADSIIRDMPRSVRLHVSEWDELRAYLIKKLEHVRLGENWLEIDSSWVRQVS